MSVTPSQFDLLAKLLDVSALRHDVIAHNVANVNTPGFHRLEVSFEEQLAEVLRGRDDARLRDREPRVVEANGGPVRQDGNNVDIDAEMGRLNKNTMLFSVYSQILASKLAAMRSAITGR